MELHAPESPIHSLKDFAIHILVVTCGILIALGLEGIRDSVHDRHLIRRLLLYYRAEDALAFVGPQMEQSVDLAEQAASKQEFRSCVTKTNCMASNPATLL